MIPDGHRFEYYGDEYERFTLRTADDIRLSYPGGGPNYWLATDL
jgi:hypothetical protein